MMKYIKTLLTIGCVLLAATGCSDKVLSEQPLNAISQDAVWTDPALMEANLNDIYRGVGHGLNEVMLSSLTDETQFIHNYGTQPVVQATISPSDRQALGSGRFSYIRWSDLYSRIRQANIFLKNTASYDGDNPDKVNRMRGEVHFLRAYFYHNLMRTYGGVPLITKVYGLKDQDTSIPRNSFKETVDFIVQDADSAAALLPLQYDGADVGRATKGAALALKSRVLLYAASDLYNVNPSGMKETGYTSASASERQARWQAAQDAAKAVMDMGMYSLYKADPAPGDSTAKNYSDLFTSKSNDEYIFQRFFKYQSFWGESPNPGLFNGVNGSHGWAGNTPIESLVDDYEMADGSKFDWNDPQMAADPYANRDPRFYASILYDGAHWKQRYSDAVAMDPYGIVQTFTTLTLPDGSTLPGIDTRDGPIENWNGSFSHYYLRKFINPAVDYRSTKQEIPWPFFRYGEILLNYAEASIGLGQDQVARDALNKIRRRAGMPEFDGSVTGQALTEEYRNERRVEMAFEEQRYFDVRRWMIAPQVLDQDAMGIEITAQGDSRPERSTYHDYNYKVIHIQDRSWDDKMYFAPISLDEMNRNDKLVQNPGY